MKRLITQILRLFFSLYLCILLFNHEINGCSLNVEAYMQLISVFRKNNCQKRNFERIKGYEL